MVQFGGTGDSSGTSGGGTVFEGEPLVIKTNGNLAAQYDGSARREIDITADAVGAAAKKHTHTANEVSGIPTVPSSMKNPFNLIIRLNGGTTEGTNQFTYDGSRQTEVNIVSTGGGSFDTSILDKYGLKANFEGTGSFSVNRAIATQKGTNSVAMGTNGKALGEASVAIGYANTASGKGSFAEGSGTTASLEASHAEGYSTTASGVASHAEGVDTIAIGKGSHAEGEGTISSGANQHVEGRFNVEDENGRFVHITGAGTNSSNRKNVYTLDWGGNAIYTGNVSASTPTTDAHLTNKRYVDSQYEAATKAIGENKGKIDGLIKNLGTNLFAAGGTVKDLDTVFENGFVIAAGTALNGPSSIEETDVLVGICLSQVNNTADDALNAIVIAIPVTRVLMDYEDEQGSVTLKAYVRQNNEGQWGYWYAMDLATGKPDDLPDNQG